MVSNETCNLYTPIEALKKHPRVCSFAVTWQQSKVVWQGKYFSFLHDNFQKFVIFHLYGQHIHQMIAENILNSNLRRKSTFADEFLRKLDFQKFSLLFCWRKKKFELIFSKVFWYNPPKKLCFSVVLNTKNDIYMKVWQS